MSDDDLIMLFMDLTVWADYLGGRLALAEIDENDANANLKVFEARYFKDEWVDDKSKPTAIKAMKEADPKVVDERQKVQQKWAYRKLMQMLFGSSERDAQAISRELSRRIGMSELHRRTGRITP